MKKVISIIVGAILVFSIAFQTVAISSVNITSIKLSSNRIYIIAGQTYTLKSTLSPANTNQKLTYTSSNNNVALVTKDGKIFGLKDGAAKITVYAPNKDVFATSYVYVAKKDKTDLTVEVFDRSTPGYQAGNNFLTSYIQKNFGDPNNINVKYVPVLRAQEIDKLNVLMAAGMAPDISFTYNDGLMYNYISNGGLTDLGSLLDTYGPALKQYLGADLLSFGKFGGKQMAIPAKRVVQSNFSAFIRKDWLDKLKLPVPTTTEQWYTTMKAFKEKDPGKLGDKNIPFDLIVDPNTTTWDVATLLDSFKKKISEQDRMTLPNWVIPGYKEGMQYLNKLFNEGILNQNFVLDQDGKQQDKDIAQGRVGFFINNYDYPYRTTPGLLTQLKKSVPGADLVPCDPFTNYEGKHVKLLYNPNGFYIIIPKFSKHAAEAMKYLEWQADPTVLKFLQNGVKGDQYTTEKNGIPMDFLTNDKLPDSKKYNFTDLAIIANGKEFGDDDKNIEAAKYGYPGFENEFSQAMKISLTDGYYGPHFDQVIQSSAKYSKTLQDLEQVLFVKSITCKPADFSKTYDSQVENYMKSGGQAIVDEKVKVYQAENK